MSKYDALEAVYARIPGIECKGLCAQEICTPVGDSTRLENKRVLERYGKPKARDDGMCSWLSDEGRCTVYEERPLICRLWGAVQGISGPGGTFGPLWCQHGCLTEAPLTHDEAVVLYREAAVAGA